MRAEVREAGFCPHWLLMLVCTELRGLTKTKIILMFYDAPQGISEVHSDICLIAVIPHDLFLLQI